jgi:hypothetical protein
MNKTDKKEDRPEYGKTYALTGVPGTKCIANGNTWAQSKIESELNQRMRDLRIVSR